MTEEKENPEIQDSREFEENPYSPDRKRPEDVVRYFYVHNIPILPVISKRGLLLGILRKEDVIAELSDLERASKHRIDGFITKLARKMSMDELLPYGKINDFVTINIFGEETGTWSRLQLFSAAEKPDSPLAIKKESESQQEEQVLEWMIYLILEHIPRGLYAINDAGRTIFYNSHFEDVYRKAFRSDVDVQIVERAFQDADKNDLVTGKKSTDLYFYNKDLKVFYEKVPMINKNKRVGFLIFCNTEADAGKGTKFFGVDIRGKSLGEIMSGIERQVLVDAIKTYGDSSLTAEALKVPKKLLAAKAEKFGIKLKK